jgi:hypothetical protein
MSTFFSYTGHVFFIAAAAVILLFLLWLLFFKQKKIQVKLEENVSKVNHATELKPDTTPPAASGNGLAYKNGNPFSYQRKVSPKKWKTLKKMYNDSRKLSRGKK